MKKILTSKWGFVFIIVLVVVAFFVFSFSQSFIGFGLNPIQNFFSESASRVKNFFEYFDDIKQVESENEFLSEQIAELTSKNLKLSSDLENSKIILSEFEYINNYEYNSVLGKIISRGTDNYLQTLIINKGTNDRVQVGYPATVQNGYIVGKVIESNKFSSKILLLNDIHSKVSVNINNDLRSPGIIIGEFGLSLKLDLIPYDHEVTRGDMVVTSGLEKNMPANLIIGEITNVTKNEGELFQSADIDQIIDIENLKILTIILPTDD